MYGVTSCVCMVPWVAMAPLTAHHLAATPQGPSVAVLTTFNAPHSLVGSMPHTALCVVSWQVVALGDGIGLI